LITRSLLDEEPPVQKIFPVNDYKIETAGLERRHPAPAHFDRIIDDDAVVIAPDGHITAVFIKRQIDPRLYAKAYRLWRTVNEVPDKRPTAVGSRSTRRQKKDGTLSNFSAVPGPVTAVLKKRGVGYGILGYMGATGNRPCQATPLTESRPELLDDNKLLINCIDQSYAQHLPSIYAKQRAVVDKAPNCRLWKTAFTTVYINKQLRTAYHADGGNLIGVMSALMAMGKFTGGELVLPRWRIAFALQPGDLLLFDPQQLHGNLPIKGKRVSAAFYCARRIGDCKKRR
jgi:hypothetical protein